MAVSDVTFCSDPKTILAVDPCLQCLSTQQVLDIGIVILAHANSYTITSDLDTLLDQSACLNCMSEKQALDGMVSSLKTAYSRSTITELIDEGKCLQCLDPGRKTALIAHLICLLLRSVSGPV